MQITCGCGAVFSIRARPGTVVTCPRCHRQVQAPWPSRPAVGAGTGSAPASAPRFWMASASLVLGLLALLLGPGTGIVAIILGLVALERVRKSDGALGGARTAVIGAGLGLAGSVLCGVLTTTVLAAGFRTMRRADQRSRQPTRRPALTPRPQPPRVRPQLPAPPPPPPRPQPPRPRQPRPVAGPPITNCIGMVLTPVSSGNFVMGSPASEAGREKHEGPQRTVWLSHTFYMSVTEVTQAQYLKIMDANPSVAKGPDLPVVNVTYEEARAFCRKLTLLDREVGRLPDGMEYRLPTEAEWEYACRADTTTRWSWGDSPADVADHACYKENSENRSHVVGSKKPNGWGLKDMHGNVWEWCLDWSGRYAASATHNPTGPKTGRYRILRGGAFTDVASDIRSAKRYVVAEPDSRLSNVGFRCARTDVRN